VGDQAPIDLAEGAALTDLKKVATGRQLRGIVAAGEGKKHQEKRPATE